MMYENSVKQNDTLTTMLNKKKDEYDQQMMRNEDLAGQNSEQISELKMRVSYRHWQEYMNYHLVISGRRNR